MQMVHLAPPWENYTSEKDKHGHFLGREMCNFKCCTEAVIRNCSCRLLHMTAYPSVRVCSPVETSFCASRINTDIRRGYDECAGSYERQACIEEEYELMTSDVPFSQNVLVESAEPLNMTEQRVRNDHMVGFEVHYRDMAENQINNTKAYSPFGLFCNIRGALELILGASIATVLECIDFCPRQRYKHYKKSRVDKVHSNQQCT